MAEDRLNRDLTRPDLSDKSAAEIEARIRDTQASLAAKLNALTSEVRVQVKDSLDRVATKVEDGVDRVAGSVSQGVERVSGSVSQGVERVSSSLDTSLQHVTTHMDTAVTNVKASLDVKARVRNEPLKMVGVAVGVGFLLAQLGSKRPRIVERRVEVKTKPVLPSPKLSMSPWALIGLAGGLLRPILVTAAKTYVVNSLHNRLSGGRDGDNGAYPNGARSAPLYHH